MPGITIQVTVLVTDSVVFFTMFLQARLSYLNEQHFPELLIQHPEIGIQNETVSSH